MARLAVSPATAILSVGDQARVAVGGGWLSVIRRRAMTIRVDGMRVLVARLFPTGEIAVWIEHARLLRALELAPRRALDAAALDAARALDRLGERLGEVLAERGCAM